MLIAQISDTHITAAGEKAYGIALTAENLRICVEHINQLHPRPDLAIITGDITYQGLVAEARHALSLLDKLTMPYFIVPGNHDDRSVLQGVFGEQTQQHLYKDSFNYVIPGYAMRLIGLDSTIPGEPGGEICDRKIKWLDERLQENTHIPTVLFMHHPPMKFGVLETDEDGFKGADALGEVVEKYANIEAVLCGHVHLEAQSRWRGTRVTSAPATGLRLVLDLTMELPSSFNLDAPAYLLHYWSPQNELITHSVSTRKLPGPYPF